MSSSELYNGGESEGIGELPSKPLMFHMKRDASNAAHATKKNSKRRHANHLIRNGFVLILTHFGAIIYMAQIGAFGTRRNNELQLYFGDREYASY